MCMKYFYRCCYVLITLHMLKKIYIKATGRNPFTCRNHNIVNDCPTAMTRNEVPSPDNANKINLYGLIVSLCKINVYACVAASYNKQYLYRFRSQVLNAYPTRGYYLNITPINDDMQIIDVDTFFAHFKDKIL